MSILRIVEGHGNVVAVVSVNLPLDAADHGLLVLLAVDDVPIIAV
jgi:hypothetical protein